MFPYGHVIIQEMWRKLVEKSKMQIPLCQMQPCGFVRIALKIDINKLQGEFFNAYREGFQVFYVCVTLHEGETRHM